MYYFYAFNSGMKNTAHKNSFWRGFLSFIRTKDFLKHAGIALISLLIFLYLLFTALDFYTGHGEKVEVPDFSNKSLIELGPFAEEKNLKYEITDSIYMPDSKPGVVVKQDPEKGSSVKPGRTIYLYISTILPPQMEMPQLADRSYRQAVFMLQSFGLKLGKTIYETGFPGAVLRQIVDGKEYTAEDIKAAKKKNKPIMIRKGSKVALVVGKEEEILIDSVK